MKYGRTLFRADPGSPPPKTGKIPLKENGRLCGLHREGMCTAGRYARDENALPARPDICGSTCPPPVPEKHHMNTIAGTGRMSMHEGPANEPPGIVCLMMVLFPAGHKHGDK